MLLTSRSYYHSLLLRSLPKRWLRRWVLQVALPLFVWEPKQLWTAWMKRWSPQKRKTTFLQPLPVQVRRAFQPRDRFLTVFQRCQHVQLQFWYVLMYVLYQLSYASPSPIFSQPRLIRSFSAVSDTWLNFFEICPMPSWSFGVQKPT